MIVCHCRGLNDRAVRDQIAAGARHVDDLVVQCGAGARCGGCRPLLVALLQEQRAGSHVAA